MELISKIYIFIVLIIITINYGIYFENIWHNRKIIQMHKNSTTQLKEIIMKTTFIYFSILKN
jgi:hypothetical protein